LFERNEEHAVRIVPLLSAVGRIANNTFVNHSRYVLLLDNGDDLLDERYYQSALVRYEVLPESYPFLHSPVAFRLYLALVGFRFNRSLFFRACSGAKEAVIMTAAERVLGQ